MKIFIRALVAGVLLAALHSAAPSFAASTVDPNTPAANSPLNSAPIRNNFRAAYNDINNILGCFSGTSAPLSPSRYQFWCDETGAPTNVLVKQYDGLSWLTTGYINRTAHTYRPAVISGSFVATPPITISVSAGVATVGLAIDSNFTVSGGSLAFANIASGSLLANCTASSAEPTAQTFTACLDRNIGTSRGMIVQRGAASWQALAAGTAGLPLLSGGGAADNAYGIPALAAGGTGANLTASVGGLVYSGAGAMAILPGTATANQIPLSGSSAAPAWSTSVWPATTISGAVLVSATANTITATRTPTFGVAGTATGSITLAGVTSGGGTISGQAAAGAATVLVPTVSGTLVASATSPVLIDATTGTVSCPTCVTSSGGSVTGVPPIAVSGAGAISITGVAGGVLAGSGPAFTNAPALGVPGTSVGSIVFGNLTSGTITVQPVTGALGTSVISFPAATDTLVGKATVDTFTNKTYSTTGTGNAFSINATAITTVVPVAVGGTGVNVASGTALDNITGFATTGFLTRTGAGTYAFQSTTNGVTLGNLAQIATNTVLGNSTSGTANITAMAVGSCSTSASALIWTTNTGFGCNTAVNAATLGGATFATPGAIGGGTPGTAAFTTVTGTSFNKVAITAPATSATLTIANLKTLTVSNTLTFTGTDGTSFAFPSGSDTVVTLGATQTLTAKTLTAPTINGGTHTAITSFGLRSTGAAFDLMFATSEVLTANRTITWTVGDAARSISLGGSINFAGSAIASGNINFGGAITTASTFSTAGAFVQAGAFATTITSTGITNATLPAGTHTLAMIDASQTFAGTQTFTLAPVFTDQAGSRTALGLGTAATQNTGTSGANVPLLNGANTWGAVQTLPSPALTGTVTGNNTIPLAILQQSAANTMLGNWTGSAANVVANTMPSCADTGGSHLNYVSGTGITCGTSTGAAAAGTLTGTTLNATVVSSSLTSVGTLTSGALGSGFTAVGLAQGGSGQTTAAAARASSGFNIDQYTGIGDADAAIAATTRTAGTTTTLTAVRTWTLPAANAVNPGQTVLVSDFSGAVNGANTISIARAGSDTINGGTSVTISTANGAYLIASDGVSKWTAQSLGSASGGGITSITAGGGLTGGVITTSGTIALDLGAANTWTNATAFTGAVTFDTTTMFVSASGNYTSFGTTAKVEMAAGTDNGATFWGNILRISANADAGLAVRRQTSDGATVRFYRDTAQVGRIDTASAGTTTYVTSSDGRLKGNRKAIADEIDVGAAIIDKTQIVAFNWLDRTGKPVAGAKRDFGVIAQDAFKVLPQAVSVGSGNPGDKDFAPWGVDYSKYVPAMIAELQSLRKRVADLERARRP